MYTGFLVGLTVLLVAAIRQPDWPPARVALLALVLALLAYAGGTYLDNHQVMPPIDQVLAGFLPWLAAQQAIWALLKGTPIAEYLVLLGVQPAPQISPSGTLRGNSFDSRE